MKRVALILISSLVVLAGCGGGEDANPPEKSGAGTSHLQQAGGDGAATPGKQEGASSSEDPG